MGFRLREKLLGFRIPQVKLSRISLQWAIGIIDEQTDREDKKNILFSFRVVKLLSPELLTYSAVLPAQLTAQILRYAPPRAYLFQAHLIGVLNRDWGLI